MSTTPRLRLTRPQIETLRFLESCGRAATVTIGDYLYPAPAPDATNRARPTRRTRSARADMVVSALLDRGLIERSLTMHGWTLTEAGRAWLAAGGRSA